MNDPFEQLLRSHRRLEERLDELTAALATLGEAREDAATIEAAIAVVDDVLGFFARAVRRHEQDEESSLFPRLRGLTELGPTLAKLADEHREHEDLQRGLDGALAAFTSLAAAEREEARAQLEDIARALVAAYRAHVALEEGTVFPAARAALDSDALDAIAREMEARREGRRGSGGQRRG